VLEGGAVWLLDPATGRLERRTIEVGLANWKFTEVLSGLAPGDTVVTSVDRQGLAEDVPAEAESPAAP
jgi:HlyD family secretion protein